MNGGRKEKLLEFILSTEFNTACNSLAYILSKIFKFVPHTHRLLSYTAPNASSGSLTSRKHRNLTCTPEAEYIGTLKFRLMGGRTRLLASGWQEVYNGD